MIVHIERFFPCVCTLATVLPVCDWVLNERERWEKKTICLSFVPQTIPQKNWTRLDLKCLHDCIMLLGPTKRTSPVCNRNWVRANWEKYDKKQPSPGCFVLCSSFPIKRARSRIASFPIILCSLFSLQSAIRRACGMVRSRRCFRGHLSDLGTFWR